MALNKAEFKQFVRDFKFRDLFVEMGWNNDGATAPVSIGGVTYPIKAIVDKSGFKILVCSPPEDGRIPDYATRKKIETKITQLFQEHLIIFYDDAKSEQLWQFVARTPGKPIKITETPYYAGQDPELLFQRIAGIFFTIDEEENLTIVDVKRRVAANFHQNADAVVKRFYTEFSKQHKSFYEFVSGLDDHIDELNKRQKRESDKKVNQNKRWYVSLMLNRLMFCYFIQKQRFLDNNQNYLREKLKAHRLKHGKDTFYSFYRTFLLVLFHDGLGNPEHDGELIDEIGKIPYLNGGLFDVHALETEFTEIEIDDDAFVTIFDFFDDWNWHLDTRVEAKGKDINPDVIGFIFEKYINERAQMGAYYTKEDITDYISKSCILPFLFEETKRNYAKAFTSGSELWQLLKSSGDTYIYDAVRHGVDEPLPADIEIGLDTNAPRLLERRKDWNKTAPASHALPTEIWREVVGRRNRYTATKQKIENGEVDEISDFISLNLNITQFAEDAIYETTDPKFLETFYKALNSVTIIDPTCGSGAFLFAAMNILESLYESCLQRMRNFIGDEDRQNKESGAFTNKHKYFRDVLNNMQSENHPNQQYFIYKNIILHNLYGVDIMKEAVEIAKLRLFLKLVATVEADHRKPNLGLEPLPDIDFNIRSGNTLVGYVSQDQIDDLAALLITAEDKGKILDDCDVVARAYKRYKEIQLSQNYDFDDYRIAKHELNIRLEKLNKSLNKTLFKEHYEGMNQGAWKDSHQPFHWFAEFYEIIHDRKGFDAVIGNPPYLELRQLSTYTVKGYLTIPTRNLYSLVLERCQKLGSTYGREGFIVPVSSISTEGYLELQNILNAKLGAFCSFDDRPSHLFDGLDKNTLSILLINSETVATHSTRLVRWSAEERNSLFQGLSFHRTPDSNIVGSLPKIGSEIEANIWSKIFKRNEALAMSYSRNSQSKTFYSRKINSFLQVLNFVPEVRNGAGELRSPSEFKELGLPSEQDANAVFCCLNSSLFRWFLDVLSDGSHLNKREVDHFPFAPRTLGSLSKDFDRLAIQLAGNLRATSEYRIMNYTHDSLTIQCIIPKFSKPVIDEIDKALAAHYGFSDGELDFIINYDIKYRMGKSLDGEID